MGIEPGAVKEGEASLSWISCGVRGFVDGFVEVEGTAVGPSDSAMADGSPCVLARCCALPWSEWVADGETAR